MAVGQEQKTYRNQEDLGTNEIIELVHHVMNKWGASDESGILSSCIQYIHNMKKFPLVLRRMESKGISQNLLQGLETLQERTDSLPHRPWRNSIQKYIQDLQDVQYLTERLHQRKVVKNTISRYERKEVLSVLELSAWSFQFKVLETDAQDDQEVKRPRRASLRSQTLHRRKYAHITCGADVIIYNVLPFLGDVESF